VAEYYAANGYMPADADSAGFNSNPDTDIVASLEYDLVTSLPYLAAKIKNAQIPSSGTDLYFALSGFTDTGRTLRWICKPGDNAGNNAMPGKYLPANCRG
jgi:hypothetical protein